MITVILLRESGQIDPEGLSHIYTYIDVYVCAKVSLFLLLPPYLPISLELQSRKDNGSYRDTVDCICLSPEFLDLKLTGASGTAWGSIRTP